MTTNYESEGRRMTRVIIRFKDGEYLNIPADYIATQDDFIKVWQGENLVAIVRQDEVSVCYLSEKKE